MNITLDSGKVFDINFICTPLRDGSRVLIDLFDDRLLSEIAADFEGAKTITKVDAVRPNVKEVFEGYTKLVAIQRNTAAETVRLTLEKGAVSDD